MGKRERGRRGEGEKVTVNLQLADSQERMVPEVGLYRCSCKHGNQQPGFQTFCLSRFLIAPHFGATASKANMYMGNC